MIADISSRVGENRGKISRSKEENQHKTQATYTLGSIPSNVAGDKQLLSHQNAFLVCPALHRGKGEG